MMMMMMLMMRTMMMMNDDEEEQDRLSKGFSMSARRRQLVSAKAGAHVTGSQLASPLSW